MKRSRTRNSFANPFLIWTDLALKTGEMMLASAQVIGHRTGLMAAAGPKPSKRDRREFTLMGQEKIEAAENGFVGITKLLFLFEDLAQTCAIQRQGHPLLAPDRVQFLPLQRNQPFGSNYLERRHQCDLS